MKELSSRERVIRAIHRLPVDRVPIDYMANCGINMQLKQHFNLKKHDDEGLLQALHVDFRELKLPYEGRILHMPVPGRRVDPQWGITTRWIPNDSGGYWDYCDFPLQDLDQDIIDAWPMPSADDYNYEALVDQSRLWPDKALYYGNPGLGDILNTTGMWCSMEKVYIAMADKNKAWSRLVDRRLSIQLEQMERSLEILKGRIDFIWMGEDLGSQIGPLISLEMYRREIRDRHKRFVDLASAFGIPVMIHSCGSSSWAFNDFIDMGIKAVDTLQPEAHDMDPAYLKASYGNRLAFHGGFSTAGEVVSGSIEETLKKVKTLLEIMMDGNGYLFSPTHMFQEDSRLENILAVYAALPTIGRYG
ncbi:MAG: uroporphyrinogen decarboxylase family protein [Sphaerochaetaceae bacterium]|jgi:uroporphyrinogen-III decarboxylase